MSRRSTVCKARRGTSARMSRKLSDYAEERGYNPYADIGRFLLALVLPFVCAVCWLVLR